MSTAEIAGGTVLVGIVGRDDPARALTWAVEAAGLERRHLSVAHVDDRGSTRDGLVSRAVTRARRSAPDLDVTGAWLHGDAEQVLVDLSTQAHLLVLGVRDRPGRVATAVTGRAACPVVLCPATAPSSAEAVLVGADGTVGSLPALELAFRQASLRDLPLQVALSATRPTSLSLPAGQPPADQGELRLQLAEAVAGLADKFPEVRLSLRLDSDDLRETLTDDRRWALVVVAGSPHQAPDRQPLPDRAAAVLEATTSPLVVVPEVPADQRRGLPLTQEETP